MIIIGYQGIGKSTLAGKLNCIDLESSNFWISQNGTFARDTEWYKPYCNIAVDLSSQGYTVFTSSHEVVRNYFKELHTSEKIYCIVPSESLKDAWIDKLHARFCESQLDKDYKAYMNAKTRYSENIDEILHSGYPTVILNNIDYKLSNVIEAIAYTTNPKSL